jgi:hypothetical protein
VTEEDKHDQHTPSVPWRGLTFSVRGLLISVLFTSLICAWIADRRRSKRTATELRAIILTLKNSTVRVLETRQNDKRERMLITQLNVGDKIAAHPDFLKLADRTLTPDEADFRLLWNHYFYPDRQEIPPSYLIYVFDLEFDQIFEGQNEFWVLVNEGTIANIGPFVIDEPSDAPESASRGVSGTEDQPRGPGDR